MFYLTVCVCDVLYIMYVGRFCLVIAAIVPIFNTPKTTHTLDEDKKDVCRGRDGFSKYSITAHRNETKYEEKNIHSGNTTDIIWPSFLLGYNFFFVFEKDDWRKKNKMVSTRVTQSY